MKNAKFSYLHNFSHFLFSSKNPQLFDTIESEIKNSLLSKFKQTTKTYAEFTREIHNNILPKFDNLDDLELFKQRYLMEDKTMEKLFKSCELCKHKYEVDKMFTCVNCKIAVYCSVECQRQDWRKGHYKICIKFGERNKPNREEMKMKMTD